MQEIIDRQQKIIDDYRAKKSVSVVSVPPVAQVAIQAAILTNPAVAVSVAAISLIPKLPKLFGW